MDSTVHVPALSHSPILQEKASKLSFIHEFGSELTMLSVFVLILICIYYIFWHTRSASDAIERRRMRVQKTFGIPTEVDI